MILLKDSGLNKLEMTTILIVLSGVRPDALAKSACPVYSNLKQQGSYLNQAKTVFPSLTLPCHMSLFHSLPPIEHLVTDDSSIPPTNLTTSLIDHLSKMSLKVGSFYSTEQLRNLSNPGSLSFSYYRNKDQYEGEVDVDLVSKAISWINSENPDFVFINLNQADEAGHQTGWMSPHYLRRVENIDRILGLLVNERPPESHLFIVGDHGGHGFDHGTKLPEDVQIPWMAVGPKIREGYQITRQVNIIDTIPTVAAVMGVKSHLDWKGSIITEIFKEQRQSASSSRSFGSNDLVALR